MVVQAIFLTLRDRRVTKLWPAWTIGRGIGKRRRERKKGERRAGEDSRG